MKMKLRTSLITIVYLSIFLAGCSRGEALLDAPVTPTIIISTFTPDPCSTGYLSEEAAKVNKLMREFDDYSALASNTPQDQLVLLIPEMQRVLRDAEDQVVPGCLEDLKEIQILHMKVVVQTLMTFISSSDVNLVNSGISQARELHTQYDIELARLLGVTFVVPPTLTPAPAAPSANDLAITVTNQGQVDVNMRNTPDLNAPSVGTLAMQASTAAFGKTADGQWILIEIPGQSGEKAWVESSLVQLSVPIDQLPVVAP